MVSAADPLLHYVIIKANIDSILRIAKFWFYRRFHIVFQYR
jgi:hypothetical protein